MELIAKPSAASRAWTAEPPALSRTWKYVIITPAYNEAGYIRAAIESVIRQTILPQRWIIVDDGSTDDTPSIIKFYAARHDFIQSVHRPRDEGQSYYASNVYAIMEGIRRTEALDHSLIAVLDADITLPVDYYEQIIARFAADPRLGVASGIYENLVNGELQRVLNDRRSTPKAIQVFRRACFEQIGGYVPLRYGGEDTCACVMARMAGWKSWSFPELKVVHHRPTGMGGARSILRARFRQGLCEYGLATHPLFMIIKSLRRCVLERPRMVGGILRLAGYTYGCLRRERCRLPAEAAKHLRREQLGRVFSLNKAPQTGSPTIQRTDVAQVGVESAGCDPTGGVATISRDSGRLASLHETDCGRRPTNHLGV